MKKREKSVTRSSIAKLLVRLIMHVSKHQNLVVLVAVLTPIFLFYGSQFVYAQVEGEPLSVQRKNIKVLNRINKYFDKRDYDKTSRLLDQFSNSPDLTNLEQAYIYNYRGNICFYQEDFECAFQEFEKILGLKEHIPDDFYFQIIDLLAQFHFSQKNYSESIAFSVQLLAGKPEESIRANFIIGQAYFEMQEYNLALSHTLKGIENRGHNGLPINPRLVRFLINIYKELNQLNSAMEFVESMDETRPKTEHKLLIAEYYGELGMNEKMRSIRESLVESGDAGYKNGKLTAWNSEGLPLPIRGSRAAYPRKAKAQNLEGWVDVMIDIDKFGKPNNLRVVDSSTKKVFDKAAIKAVRGYLYQPVLKKGEPVELKNYVTRISFKLEESKKN